MTGLRRLPITLPAQLQRLMVTLQVALATTLAIRLLARRLPANDLPHRRMLRSRISLVLPVLAAGLTSWLVDRL